MHAMIIVLGRVTVRPDALPQAQALASEHVARSRAEPGCLAHGFSIDAENPLELVFVEKWQSLAHLQAHFAVPASRALAKDLMDTLDKALFPDDGHKIAHVTEVNVLELMRQ